MTSRKTVGPIALALAGVVAIGAAFADDPPPSQGAGPTPAPKKRTGTAPKTKNFNDYVYSKDEAIGLFEARVKLNPDDYTSLATLGDLYERRARETDDLASFAHAENALRRALEIFPSYAKAKVSLAVVLGDRHKFAEALTVAQSALDANPKDLDALATVGDAQLELGRYAEAEKSFRQVSKKLPKSPQVMVRLARIEEIKGHPEEALALVRRAIEALKKGGATPADTSWYRFREADILFNLGRVNDAGKVAEAILKADPKHHDATATLARVRAAQGRDRDAIALYEKAVDIAPDPGMVVALADLWAKQGDAAWARELYDWVVKATSVQPEYRRVLSGFYADHDRDLPRAFELAKQDIAERQDVYGYDALAWALLKNDRPEEASKAMADALKQGTRDARLYFHAGMIAHRLGQTAKARNLLEKALALNPHFSPEGAEQARKTLAELTPAKKP